MGTMCQAGGTTASLGPMTHRMSELRGTTEARQFHPSAYRGGHFRPREVTCSRSHSGFVTTFRLEPASLDLGALSVLPPTPSTGIHLGHRACYHALLPPPPPPP